MKVKKKKNPIVTAWRHLTGGMSEDEQRQASARVMGIIPGVSKANNHLWEFLNGPFSTAMVEWMTREIPGYQYTTDLGEYSIVVDTDWCKFITTSITYSLVLSIGPKGDVTTTLYRNRTAGYQGELDWGVEELVVDYAMLIAMFKERHGADSIPKECLNAVGINKVPRGYIEMAKAKASHECQGRCIWV